MSEKVEFPRFIETTPCGEDQFSSMAQTQLSITIAECIKPGNPGFRLIGLDGSWGAGKSNVIKMIQNQLQDTHHMFVYDAWSHQEDLQRRSFLEGLTEDLQRHHVIDQAIWRDKLEELLSKKKKIKQRSIPRLSPAVVVALISAVLVPFSSTVASTVQNVWLKLFLASLPFIIAIVIWIVAGFRNRKNWKLPDLFYIYKEKDEETITSETISESEPSVREFRNWMFDLEAALKKEINLIIVFDNMDRLPEQKVQVLWSSIHTFFSENNPHKKIWVIVPFDRVQINTAFSNDNKKAEHFISKTFSVIFRVPPAVLTDWSGFFETKFGEAFGEKEMGEILVVKGIFDRYYQHITPRMVIFFINELVTLKLIWKDTFGLRYMALFLVNKETLLSDPALYIISKSYRSKVDGLFSEDTEVDDNIAALVYNVPKDIASQVTLQREIITAIRETNTDRMKRLSQHRDFFLVLDGIYANEVLDFIPSVHTLDFIDVKEEGGYAESVMSRIWILLVLKQLSTLIDELKLKDTQIILLRNCPENLRLKLVKHIVIQFGIARDFDGGDYYYSLTDLQQQIGNMNLGINLLDLVPRRNMNPPDFISYVLEAQKEYQLFNVYCDKGTLETHLISELNSNRDSLRVLEYIRKDYYFPQLLKLVEEVFSLNGMVLKDLTEFLTYYRNLSTTRLLKIKISDELIDKFLNEAGDNNEEFFELVAMRLARGDSWMGTSQLAEDVISDINELEVKAVAERIESYSHFGDLLKLVVSWKKPLLSLVIASLIRKTEQETSLTEHESPLNITEILTRFDDIVEVTGVSEKELLMRIDEWSKLVKNELTLSNLPDIVHGIGIFNAANNFTCETGSHVLALGKSKLEELDEGDWIGIFSEETNFNFHLLVWYIEKGIMSRIPAKAKGPFEDRIHFFAREVKPEVKYIAEWKILFRVSEQIQCEGIRDSFISSGNLVSEHFVLFEEMLRTKGNIADRRDDVIPTILVPVLTDEKCIQLIMEQQEFYLEFVKNAEKDKLKFIYGVRKFYESHLDFAGLHFFASQVEALITGKVKVLEARYYTDQFSVDVTVKVKQMVEQNRNYHFKLDNSIVNWEDPHFGVVKVFDIKYIYQGEDILIQYTEGDWVSLP